MGLDGSGIGCGGVWFGVTLHGIHSMVLWGWMLWDGMGYG